MDQNYSTSTGQTYWYYIIVYGFDQCCNPFGTRKNFKALPHRIHCESQGVNLMSAVTFEECILPTSHAAPILNNAHESCSSKLLLLVFTGISFLVFTSVSYLMISTPTSIDPSHRSSHLISDVHRVVVKGAPKVNHVIWGTELISYLATKKKQTVPSLKITHPPENRPP